MAKNLEGRVERLERQISPKRKAIDNLADMILVIHDETADLNDYEVPDGLLVITILFNVGAWECLECKVREGKFDETRYNRVVEKAIKEAQEWDREKEEKKGGKS